MFNKFFFTFFNKFIHNKLFENILIKQLMQITIFENVFNIVQFFIRRSFYL